MKRTLVATGVRVSRKAKLFGLISKTFKSRRQKRASGEFGRRRSVDGRRRRPPTPPSSPPAPIAAAAAEQHSLF